MKNSLFLIDGYGLIYKSYFALIRAPLTGTDGKNKSAVMGFFRTLLGIMKNADPSHLVILMDSKTKTFRSEIYPEYKIQRDKTPQDLIDQIDEIEQLMTEGGFQWVRKNSYEADDLIATYAVKYEGPNRVSIYSSDKDLMQLVNDKVHMVKSEKGKLRDLGPEDVLVDKGVPPEQILDYLSLMGDAADNIPGVPGVGPKTASKLLQEFGSLDGIYENLENIKSKVQKTKLANNKEGAYFSRKLVLLEKMVSDLPEAEALSLNREKLSAFVSSLEEKGLKKLGEDYRKFFLLDEFNFNSDNAETPKAEKYELIVKTVTTTEDLKALTSLMKKAGLGAMDTETTGLNPFEAELVGISVSLKEGEGWYIPLHSPDAVCLDGGIVREALQSVMDHGFRIIGQNWKFDLKILSRWGLKNIDPFFDTMIAAWMVNPLSNRYSMDYLAEQHLGRTTIHYQDTVEKGENFSSVPLARASDYAAEDAEVTFCLYNLFKDEIEKAALGEVFDEIEMPLVPVLADMELQGIGLDTEEMRLYGEKLARGISEVEKEVYDLCGREFNLKSPKQLQEVLFDERKLTPGKKTKTGYSTDNQVLRDLSREDPVPEMILRHRSLSKLLSTYVDVLPGMVQEETGRIHTHYMQHGTATGRISSNDPNLQNIPVKDEAGRKIRSCFIPRPGYTFISADYSQIELVILAHLSGDEELVKAYREKRDVHAQTASLVFGTPVEEVVPEQRRIAKTINFGVMYGMSAFRLSRELAIPRKDAAQFIENYFRVYHGIRHFMNSTVAKAEEEGCVRTIFGRRRPLPRIKSRNKMEKSAEERIAVNTPIQGTAADIMKKAMLAVSVRLKEEHMKTRVLLQVHDELILESPDDEINRAEELVREAMEGVVSLSVPLTVQVESGKSWGNIH